MPAHRADVVRPRWARIGIASASAGVTAVALLGGIGAFPSAADRAPAVPSSAIDGSTDVLTPAASGDVSTAASGSPGSADRREASANPASAVALPRSSGSGRRVVFSESQQRVWLVPRGRQVTHTYLVSGSLYDNLDPGTYEVYSRSEQAWGIDDSGTMKYFVRFTQGDSAAIGFHDIPIDDGTRVQTFDQLGTPQSHGCIRQRRSDAKRMWAFAPIGTTVVVVA